MKYIVTGVDGKLGGRVAENMIKEAKAKDLILTCPVLECLDQKKRMRWEDITGEKPKTARELAQNYSYIWEKHITHWKDIK